MMTQTIDPKIAIHTMHKPLNHDINLFIGSTDITTLVIQTPAILKYKPPMPEKSEHV